MCGIAGIVTRDRGTGEEAVRRMNEAQRHRGPDDSGIEAFALPDACLVLGHRRLAILDTSPAGRQPMADPATGSHVVYNGELYNFPELRRELEAAGAVFRTRCDTEVVLAAYARWGTGCFERFEGMFALALYDAAARRLVLARDHLGIKPLYVAESAEVFAFASEVKALGAGGVIRGEVDRRALAGLLAYGGVPAPLTLWRGVRTLDPGVWASLDLAASEPWRRPLSPRRFWSFPSVRPELQGPELQERMRRRLAAAVRSHLLSDVPVGILLSSGLDSNVVARLASLEGHAGLDAFTVTLADEAEADEGPVAARMAGEAGLRFHRVALSEDEVRLQADAFLDAVDQPSVDGLNTYVISRAVRERGIVVALSGLGGDEVFGGYDTFRDAPRLASWHRRTRWIPASWRRWAAGQLYRHGSPARRFKAMELASRPSSLRSFCLRRRRLFSDAELLAAGFVPTALELDEDFLPGEAEPGRGLDPRDPVATVSVLESRFYMGNVLLRDADVYSMAHGLELRVPLLDRRVVDLAYAVAGAIRAPRGERPKALLAGALGQDLSPELLALPKRGFHLPIGSWMRGPLREMTEASIATVKRHGLLGPSVPDAVWHGFLEHPGGPDWSRAWLLCVLGRWLETRGKDRADA